MAIDIVLAGNGPGELSGWVRPVAQAARNLGVPGLRVTLALSPSQFAGGRESQVVQQWELFDRIVAPANGVRIALGLERLPLADSGVLVHLGGDLWFSSRLAGRLGVPAYAFAETTLIAKRHRPFTRIFAASDTLARQLISAGVPAEKIVVSGDPRVDVIREQLQENHQSPSPQPSPPRGEGRSYVVSFMPSSRDRFFLFLVPYYLHIAGILHTKQPETVFQIVVSPFLSPELVAKTQGEVATRWPQLGIHWILKNHWVALARSDVVLTIPGTNTLELAMAGIPFGVVLDLNHADRAPLEGAAEWVGRLPWLGGAIKRAGVARYVATHRFVALPNLRASRMIVPEWIGRWTPQELAEHVRELLARPEWRDAMRTELQSLYGGAEGASRLIAEQAVTLAQQMAEMRT